MTGPQIIFAILAVMVALFVSNRVPVAPVALSATLLLHATGVLTLSQAISGFGDPTVLFIASLFVVSASLDASGVTTWAGQLLLRHAGESHARLLVMTMLLAGGLTALIGASGTVTALLPVVILVAVRLRKPPSQLMLPLAFAAHAGSMLVLTASLVNVLLSNAAVDAGLPPFGYFELTVIGVPLLAGTIAIVVLLGHRLLPQRAGRALPEDLSRHSRTLAEQYNLFDDIVQLELAPTSHFAGARVESLKHENHVGLSLIAIQARDGSGPVRRPFLEAGDIVLVRGDKDAIARFAEERRLVERQKPQPADLRDTLFNSIYGYAEVVIPPRSAMIGKSVFPGMVASGGDLIILGIQRRGQGLPPGEAEVAAGDTLLLQGTWVALDELHQDPDVLVVDSPDLVRRQSVAMGHGATRALLVLGGMVVMLATGIVPTVVAGLVAACATVLLGVLKAEQAYRAINGTALIMVASLIPLSTAMYQTGAADLVADALVRLVSGRSPYALLACLFFLTALLGQLISSTATALIIIPIALAAATEIGVSPRTAFVTVAIAAAASFLTPVASSVNLIVQGPGGYRFGDYWRLGLPLMAWFFLVVIFIVPLVWPF